MAMKSGTGKKAGSRTKPGTGKKAGAGAKKGTGKTEECCECECCGEGKKGGDCCQ